MSFWKGARTPGRGPVLLWAVGKPSNDDWALTGLDDWRVWKLNPPMMIEWGFASLKDGQWVSNAWNRFHSSSRPSDHWIQSDWSAAGWYDRPCLFWHSPVASYFFTDPDMSGSFRIFQKSLESPQFLQVSTPFWQGFSPYFPRSYPLCCSSHDQGLGQALRDPRNGAQPLAAADGQAGGDGGWAVRGWAMEMSWGMGWVGWCWWLM